MSGLKLGANTLKLGLKLLQRDSRKDLQRDFSRRHEDGASDVIHRLQYSYHTCMGTWGFWFFL